VADDFVTNISMCSILIVEDHDDTRQAFASLLRSWGHEVSTGNSAAGGLAFLDSHEVDVILSDIGLPDQDGYAFIARVRQTNLDVTAIAISAYFTANDQRRGRAAGFDMYFPKPVDLSGLRLVLARMKSGPPRNGNGENEDPSVSRSPRVS
jgi:CheY-like chemotaxis protein